MRDPEPRLVDLCVSVEQEVEIERPRALGRHGRPVAAEAGLDGEEQVQELPRRQRRSRGPRPRSGSAADRDSRRAPYRRAWRRRRPRPRRAAASSASAARIVDSRSPRLEPSPTYARGTRASLATLRAGSRGSPPPRRLRARSVPLRRGDARPPCRGAADPLEPQEWWLSKIGADRPPPRRARGVPITIVDSGTDPTHPEFAGRPNTTFLNDQTTFGSEEYHGTIVASVAAAPENGVGIVGVYPTAALQIYDASPTPADIGNLAAVRGSRRRRALSRRDQPQLRGHDRRTRNCGDAILHGGAQRLPRRRCGRQQRPDAATRLVSRPLGRTSSPSQRPTERRRDTVLASSPATTSPRQASRSSAPCRSTATRPGTRPSAGTSFSAPIVSAAAAWVWTVRPTLTASQVAAVLRARRARHRPARLRQCERLRGS